MDFPHLNKTGGCLAMIRLPEGDRTNDLIMKNGPNIVNICLPWDFATKSVCSNHLGLKWVETPNMGGWDNRQIGLVGNNHKWGLLEQGSVFKFCKNDQHLSLRCWFTRKTRCIACALASIGEHWGPQEVLLAFRVFKPLSAQRIWTSTAWKSRWRIQIIWTCWHVDFWENPGVAAWGSICQS